MKKSYLLLLVLLAAGHLMAQETITMSGKVTDDLEEPLPGVNVLIKGTIQGTVTDINGQYTLEMPRDAEALVFSYVGFITEEIAIGGRSVVDVILTPDILALSEVVVVGYGTQRKSDVTGSVVRVTTEATKDLPNFDVLQSIQGRIPGVNIAVAERPGQTDLGLNIRGSNTLSRNDNANDPLIVVDGIIYNGNISDFNPNDIASIDVLKDASAAAVYGARAANGVLLLTTRKGTTDNPTFNFNTYQGFQEPATLVDVLDGAGYERKIADYNAILLAENPDASLIELTEAERLNRDNGVETDWIDLVLQTGRISNYHLDVSGRTDKVNYYVAGTYLAQEGIIENDNYDRVTLNMNLTNEITDWYSVTLKTAFSAEDRSGEQAGGNDPNGQATLDRALRQSPYGNVFDEEGPGGYALFPMGLQTAENPMVRTLVDDIDKRNSFWGLISSNLQLPFLPGFKWTLNYSNNLRTRRDNRFTSNDLSPSAQNLNGIASKRHRRYYDWTFDNILNYKQLWNEKHSFDLTLLISREYREFEDTRARATTFVSQALGYHDLDLGEIQTVESNFTDQNSIAQMARLNYIFDDRYAFTFTVRRDGFSAFAANNKYATFPSAAFAWTPTNEAFLDGVEWLDYLKLRLSYGENGNQAINRYSSLARIGTSQYLFGNDGNTVATFNVNTQANDELTWETTVSRNIGLDFEVLDSRLTGSIDAYLSNTTDLLQDRRLPRTTGFRSVLSNIGEVQNKGIEIALNSDNLRNKPLSWQTGVAFALNRNEIISLGGLDADGDGVEDDDILNRWFIGEPINVAFGFATDGIYQVDDEIPDGNRPGDFRLVDYNGDREITPEDRHVLGTTDPRYQISVSNTLRYKQFSLYIMINSLQGGRDYYIGDNFETRSVNRRDFVTYSEIFNFQDVPYWTPDNPTNEYPRLDYNPTFNHPIIEDRSFIRIQDISLAYNFNESLLERIKLRDMRAYVSVKNLLTFTDWSGYNPERSRTIQDFPFLRTYTVGLDFSF